MSDAPQRRKLGLIIGGCTALVIVAVAFFLVGRSSGSPSGSKNTTTKSASTQAAPKSSSKTSTPADDSSNSNPPKSATTLVAVAPAGGANAGMSGLEIVKAASLPPEARTTLKLIDSKGPYPYSRDGVVYNNLEKILPKQAKGYYHEYTVVTPGSKDRGARRVIAGGKGERFYTDDHYASFKEVVG
jgi:ribonuclease T1